MPARTPEEIRASIEQNRQELGTSIERLRGEVVELTDWRKQLTSTVAKRSIGAAVAGFVIGGGIAALGGASSGVAAGVGARPATTGPPSRRRGVTSSPLTAATLRGRSRGRRALRPRTARRRCS